MLFNRKSNVRPSSSIIPASFKFHRSNLGQVRYASLIKRPYRPYTFTQLIVLCDGSTFTMRTTSPAPVYKSNKDSRNHPLWQPSSAALRNVESDEAGRLSAFRSRFGYGWDSPTKLDYKNNNTKTVSDKTASNSIHSENKIVPEDNLMDLISGAASGAATYTNNKAAESKENKTKV